MSAAESTSSDSDRLADLEAPIGVGELSDDASADGGPDAIQADDDDWSLDMRCKHCKRLFSYGKRHIREHKSWWSYLRRYKVQCPGCFEDSDPFVLPDEVLVRPRLRYSFCDRLVGRIFCARQFSLKYLSLEDVKRVACGIFLSAAAIIISSILFHYASIADSRPETVALTVLGLLVLSVLPGAMVAVGLLIRRVAADSQTYEIV